MAARQSVRIYSAALDEFQRNGRPDIVIRGVVDPDSLDLLQVDDYQREILPSSTIDELARAIKENSVPSIEVGMRGDSVQDRDGAMYLMDPVYIVDGLQRVSAAKRVRAEGFDPHLGITVHLGTNHDWERERFETLNVRGVRLSANILVRNLHDTNPAIATLITLSRDTSFILGGKICWQQRRGRGELLSAVTYIKVVGRLHAHAGPGRSSNVLHLARGLTATMETVGRTTMRDNVRTFFQLVDEAWDLRNIVYREKAPHVRTSFLMALAAVLSDHMIFWQGNRLVVTKPMRKKIAQFPILDPSVRELTSASGSAMLVLARLIVDHINSGRRTGKLVPRVGDENYLATNGDDEEGSEGSDATAE